MSAADLRYLSQPPRFRDPTGHRVPGDRDAFIYKRLGCLYVGAHSQEIGS
jgi:hypothetical protein